jgi:hypothetical protein
MWHYRFRSGVDSFEHMIVFSRSLRWLWNTWNALKANLTQEVPTEAALPPAGRERSARDHREVPSVREAYVKLHSTQSNCMLFCSVFCLHCRTFLPSPFGYEPFHWVGWRCRVAHVCRAEGVWFEVQQGNHVNTSLEGIVVLEATYCGFQRWCRELVAALLRSWSHRA